MLRYKLIVFDWDGTLVDSSGMVIANMRDAIVQCDLPLPDDKQLRAAVGLGPAQVAATLFPENSQSQLNTLASAFQQQMTRPGQQFPQLMPGAKQVLADLEQIGMMLAVATGKGRDGLNRDLHHMRLSGQFHVTRCADETRAKPHPQMLEEILQFTGVEAISALMVGDTEFDLQMAANAGVSALAVSYGSHSRERLSRHEPIACIDSLADLQAVIGAEG